MSDTKEATASISAKTTAKSGVSDLKGIGMIGKLVGILVVLWLISISYYAFAFFALGMLPAVVAIVIDRGAGRFASKTVTACNFVGIMPYLFDISMTPEPSLPTKQLMAQPMTWLVIYGAAAVGWMLIWIMPQVTLVVFTIRADLKRTKLMEDQTNLLDEWGEEVRTGGSKSSR